MHFHLHSKVNTSAKGWLTPSECYYVYGMGLSLTQTLSYPKTQLSTTSFETVIMPSHCDIIKYRYIVIVTLVYFHWICI